MGGNSLQWFGGLGLALALSMAAALPLAHYAPFARIGAAYAAKQTCSCLFVSGRPLESCLQDFSPRDRALLSIRAEAEAVRTSALGGLASARARFEPGFGCSLTP